GVGVGVGAGGGTQAASAAQVSAAIAARPAKRGSNWEKRRKARRCRMKGSCRGTGQSDKQQALACPVPSPYRPDDERKTTDRPASGGARASGKPRPRASAGDGRSGIRRR